MSYNSVSKIWSGPSNPPIYNSNVGLGHLFLNVMKITPNRVVQINAESGRKMTCKELSEKSMKIAKFLSERGFKQSDVVGIVARNSDNLLPLLMACLTLGLPVNPLATYIDDADYIHMFSNTQPKVVICDADLVEKIEKIGEKIQIKWEIITLCGKVKNHVFIDDLISGENEEFSPPPLNNIASTPAFIMCSSSTTGFSKGVIKSHKQWIENDLPPHPFVENEVYFKSALISWTTTICSIMYAVLYGAIHLFSPVAIVDDDLFMEILRKFNVTTTLIIGMQQYSLIKRKWKTVPSVKFAYIIGVPISMEVIERIKVIFPNAEVVGCYGMTEVNYVAFSNGGQKGTSAGKILSNYQVKIIDESGKNLGPKQLGQICIKPPVLFDGYYNEPAKFAETIEDGWVLSGDLGYFDDENYLYVTDRIKNLLKSNLLDFSAMELEVIIDGMEGVKKSAVVGVYDEGCDVIYAFVVRDEKGENLTSEGVKTYVNERISELKNLTGDVIFIDEFPMTAIGKIRKFKLKEIASKIHMEKKGY